MQDGWIDQDSSLILLTEVKVNVLVTLNFLTIAIKQFDQFHLDTINKSCHLYCSLVQQ